MGKCLLWGMVIGILAGLLEALLTATGQTDYWLRFRVHYSQLGIHGWFFGLIGGYIVCKALREHHSANQDAGLCSQCGYNLTGNVSGTCPECGAPVQLEPDKEEHEPG